MLTVRADPLTVVPRISFGHFLRLGDVTTHAPRGVISPAPFTPIVIYIQLQGPVARDPAPPCLEDLADFLVGSVPSTRLIYGIPPSLDRPSYTQIALVGVLSPASRSGSRAICNTITTITTSTTTK